MDAKEFRIACATLNLSHAEMAKLLKKSKSTVSRWVTGKFPVPHMAALAIKQLVNEFEGGAEHADKEPVE